MVYNGTQCFSVFRFWLFKKKTNGKSVSSWVIVSEFSDQIMVKWLVNFKIPSTFSYRHNIGTYVVINCIIKIWVQIYAVKYCRIYYQTHKILYTNWRVFNDLHPFFISGPTRILYDDVEGVSFWLYFINTLCDGIQIYITL